MHEPVTVLHLRISNFVGGPEKQILEHFKRLDPKRFRPLLCCYRENGQDDPLLLQAELLGITCRNIECTSAFDPMIISRLRRVLIADKIDILCTHGYKPNVLGRIASFGTGVKAVAISRGWTGENPKIRFYEKLDKFFLRHASHIVAVSNGQRDKIVALGIQPGKVTVIHNAINLAEIPEADGHLLRRELGLPDDAIIVASAGRLSPEKNYAAMIEASQVLIQNNPKIYFVIFGEGFLRPGLEAQIASTGLTGRFLLPGFRTDLQAIMHDIDIFMLPSFTEGLPNVVLEAFAARKPVVATRVGGTPEVVQDGISGFLTRSDEPELMARHLLALADDPDLRQRMGHAGYAYTKEHFSFTAQTEAYEQLYTDLHQAKKRRH